MIDVDIHLLTGAYAANALPEDEKQAFEAHLSDCPSCTQEVLELTATTARLAAAAAEPAPARLRDRVLAEIQLVRQRPPSDQRLSPTAEAAPPPWYRQTLGVAAAFLLLLSLGLAAVAVDANRDAERAENVAARIAAVATDPDRVTLDHEVTTGGTATVVAASGNAVFRAEGLAVLPEDRGYQLWVMDADGARSVGVLGRGTSSHVEHFVEGVSPGDQLGLTVEPSSGSDRPTTDPVLLMTMDA